MATALVENEALYVIQHKKSQAIKIGITKDWPSRANQLKVGEYCISLKVVHCENSLEKEKQLHQKYKRWRLPSSEWFFLTKFQIKNLIKKITSFGKDLIWKPNKRGRPIISKKPQKLPIYVFSQKEIDKYTKKIKLIPNLVKDENLPDIFLCKSGNPRHPKHIQGRCTGLIFKVQYFCDITNEFETIHCYIRGKYYKDNYKNLITYTISGSIIHPSLDIDKDIDVFHELKYEKTFFDAIYKVIEAKNLQPLMNL